MIRAGFETIDPTTRTRWMVIKGAEETGGRGWMIDVHCPEGAPPTIPEHLHLSWTEMFEILQGEAMCRIAGTEQMMRAGTRLVMSAGVPHVHPWNIGSGVMVYRQTTEFGKRDPRAVHDVLGAFATMNGLARKGRIGKNGLPRNPLQFAATLRTLTKYGGFDAKVPIAIQRALGATAGRLAEALGYRGADPRYIQR